MNDFNFERGSIVGNREFSNKCLLVLDGKERSEGRKSASVDTIRPY
jgi:hypothetical protein